MRIAVYSPRLNVPPRVGSDVHTVQMAAALARRGHSVQYLTAEYNASEEPPVPVRALAPREDDGFLPPPGPVVRRLVDFWSLRPEPIAALRRALEAERFDALIVGGESALLWLRWLPPMPSVWYAPDEIAIQALGLIRPSAGLRRCAYFLKRAAAAAIGERLFGRLPGEIWVVAEKDRRAMERITGRRDVRVIANGVDLERFRPVAVEIRPRRAVFWGALNFAPNVQAVEWFVGRVWPEVRRRVPDAEFQVMGFSPTDRVRAVTRAPGVVLKPDVPDLRPEVCAAEAAVYPFVSGTGIKNKLLEGAAMARALVASPVAVDGLVAGETPPWVLCRRPADWVEALEKLWASPEEAAARGRQAREWAARFYTWDRAAALAEDSLERAVRGWTPPRARA